MGDMQHVLVTGCSSGFGRLIVETLARRGHAVVGGMRARDGRNAEAAAALRALGARVVDLDVASDDSVRAAVDEAARLADGLDVVVNNAGVASFGVTEAFTVEQVAAVFDTNVFGALRVNRAALPHLRRSGAGLLVQIGTSIGRVPLPFMGVYCAAKAAAEMLAEEARHTLAPLGIDSVIVAPSTYPTAMLGKLAQPADVGRLAGYGPLYPAMEQLGNAMQSILATKPDPQEVADAVVALVEAPRGTRPLRTLVGNAHPPRLREHYDEGERIVADFYGAIGVGGLLAPRP